MKIKLLALAGFLVLANVSNAQDENFISKLDSLGGIDDSTKSIMVYNEGLDLMNSKKYSEAIQKFNEALNLNIGFIDAKFSRGQCYMGLKSDDKAIGDWESCIKDDPTYEKAYFEIYQWYSKSGKTSDTRKYLDLLIGLNPKETKYYYNRGALYFASNQLDSALMDYNKAIELKADNAYALNDRGGVYVKKGELDKAISDYEKAAKAAPKESFVFNNLGSAYRKKGDLDKALTAYNKAIELQKDYTIAYNNRGMVLLAKGDLDKAKADFDKAISQNAGYALAYSNRASVYIKKEEWRLAVMDCDKAITLNKDFAYAYYNRAIAKEMLRELDGACEDWHTSYDLGLDAGKTHFNTWCNN